MENFNEAIDKALLTWYPKDHPLHFNPHHPLGKLCGEWGELLDDYMKSIYKPDYRFEPENELGDIWYYLRILCYQQDYRPSGIVTLYQSNWSTDLLLAGVLQCTVSEFLNICVLHDRTFNTDRLGDNYATLVEIAKRYNLTIDQLTTSNWEKLKPGSERGEQWRKARIENYVNSGKIGEIS